MGSKGQITMEVVLLSTEGVGIVFTKERLAACLPALKKMVPGEWHPWQRKVISTDMTAEVIAVLIKCHENPKFLSYESLRSCEITLQVLKACLKYDLSELWKFVSERMCQASDTWFNHITALESLDLILKAYPRPNTVKIADKLLTWLSLDLDLSWKSFDQNKLKVLSQPGNENMTCMNFPFPRDYVLLMIAPQNQVHEIQVKKNTTVFDMKQQYANISKRPSNLLRFIWHGRELAEDQTPESVQMWKVDIVKVVFRQPPRCSGSLSQHEPMVTIFYVSKD